MSYPLKPWTRAAFELIAHAEQHLRVGADFDRRVALIGFDNAIEIAITTYLALHPIQRSGREYPKDHVAKWMINYHSKLEFLEREASERSYVLTVPCDEIVYFHKIRSDQYHTGGSGVPEAECISALRAAALDIFSFLFAVDNIEDTLEGWLEAWEEPEDRVIQRDSTADWLIDDGNEAVVVAGDSYDASEILRQVDPKAYGNVLAAISESQDISEELRVQFPLMVRSDLRELRFVHYADKVYLKLLLLNGELILEDTDFIGDDEMEDDHYFSRLRSPTENARRFIEAFDAFSIANCFDLFTESAKDKVSRTRNQAGVDEHRSDFEPEGSQ